MGGRGPAHEALGNRVLVVDPRPDFPDMVLAAAAAVVHDDDAVLGRVSPRGNVTAETQWDAALRALGLRTHRLPRGYEFAGGRDALFAGETLFCKEEGKGDARMHSFISRTLGVEVVGLRLTTRRVSLDAVFCPLDGNAVMYAPDLLARESISHIRAHIPHIIEVPPEIARSFGLSAAVVGQVVIGNAATRLIGSQLASEGYKFVEVPVDAFSELGGGVRSLSLPLPAAILAKAPVLDQLVVVALSDQLRALPARQLAPELVTRTGAAPFIASPLIIVPRIQGALRAQLDEFDAIINESAPRESVIQRFFERNPHFLQGIDYERVVARPLLTGSVGSDELEPDFLLEPVGRTGVDILELKLPTETVIVGGRNRRRLSAAVTSAVAQVRTYRQALQDPEVQARLAERYGLAPYRPYAAVLIGRSPVALDREFADEREELPSWLRVTTYDEMFARMRRMAEANL